MTLQKSIEKFTEENKELLYKIFSTYIRPFNQDLSFKQFCKKVFSHQVTNKYFIRSLFKSENTQNDLWSSFDNLSDDEKENNDADDKSQN